MRSRTRLVFAAAIAFAGVVVAWRGLDRQGPPKQTTVPPPEKYPAGFVRPGDPPLEDRPTSETLPAIARRAAQRVRESASELPPEDSLTSQQIEQLAQLIERRVRLIFEPSEAAWVEESTRLGFPPHWANVEQDLLGFSKEVIWQGVERCWKHAPLSVARMQVRRLYISDPRLRDQLSNAYNGSPFRASYPAAPKGVKHYDVLIPAETIVRVNGKERKEIVHISMVHWWNDAEGRWIPSVLWVSSRQGGLQPPPF